jgi:Mrp family chromosome partitioning ATPase
MPLPLAFRAPPTLRNQDALVPQPAQSLVIDLSCTLPHGELTKLYRAIETALPDTQHRVVQFVSAYESEGASLIAFETAVIAARLVGKRVLFIDTAPAQLKSSRRLPPRVGIPLDTLLLTGRPPREAIAQADGVELYFATLRERGPDGFTTASLSAVESALANLRTSFDLILIDSQAIFRDAFGMALAKLVDGSILVIEAERTRGRVAIESKRLIEASGGRMIGSILNKRRFYIPRALYRFLYARQAV